MNARLRLLSAAAVALFVSVLALRPAAETATAKPEDVGLSSERLGRITEMMKRHIAAGEISGGVTLVARHGRIAHFEATGVTDIESKKPMTKDAVFRIASMTKPVTGVAIMMMMEEGKLRITDPVSKYIPSFKDLKVAVPLPRQGPPPAPTNRPRRRSSTRCPAEREVTIRDLLTHTSGLASGPMSNSDIRKPAIARKPTDTLADYVPRLGKSALEFQPGSRWTYSPQAGFDTLGRIVEITSGQPFDQFLRQRAVRAAWHQGRLVLSDARARAAHGDGLSARPEGEDGEEREPRVGCRARCTSWDRAASSRRPRILEVRADARQRRRVERQAAAQPADGRPTWRRSTRPTRSQGRVPGEGFGLSVRVVKSAVASGSRVSDGSFGWSGAYGTHFWVDQKEDLIAVLMIQTPVRDMRPEFENAVMQAILK